MTELDGPPFEPGLVMEALERHQVRYIVVGGIAGNLHGAQRPTQDFDMVALSGAENLARVAAALNELGARLRVGGLTDAESAELSPPVRADTLDMEISTWMTDAGAVDVLRDIPSRRGEHSRYEDLLPGSTEMTSDRLTVKVVGLDDLIRSKEWADRPKDHESLGELRALRDAQGQGPDLLPPR